MDEQTPAALNSSQIECNVDWLFIHPTYSYTRTFDTYMYIIIHIYCICLKDQLLQYIVVDRAIQFGLIDNYMVSK